MAKRDTTAIPEPQYDFDHQVITLLFPRDIRLIFEELKKDPWGRRGCICNAWHRQKLVHRDRLKDITDGHCRVDFQALAQKRLDID